MGKYIHRATRVQRGECDIWTEIVAGVIATSGRNNEVGASM